jgi:hypothetical protein
MCSGLALVLMTVTGLCAMVRQSDLAWDSMAFRGHFPDFTQFDACPVGWYNLLNEFYGKDGGPG